MRHAKRTYGLKKTLLTLVIVAVVVNASMISYGLFWKWIIATGFIEQNTVSIKPQEYPGTPMFISSSVPSAGPGIRLTTKNDSRQLVNPIKPNSKSVERGKRAYDISCTPCHGADGDGYGLMGAVPRLSPALPEEVAAKQKYFRAFLGYTPDIDASFVLNMTDGEIYFTITKGGEAIMPGFSDALSPDTRWDLINYIKYGMGVKREL